MKGLSKGRYDETFAGEDGSAHENRYNMQGNDIESQGRFSVGLLLLCKYIPIVMLRVGY